MSRLERQLLAYNSRSKEARDAEVRLGLFAWEPSRKSLFRFGGKMYAVETMLNTRAIANALAGNWWPYWSLTKMLGPSGIQRLNRMARLHTTNAAGAPLVRQPLVYWDAPDQTNSDSLLLCPVGRPAEHWLTAFTWHMLLDDFHRDAALCKLAWESAPAFADMVLVTMVKPKAPKLEVFHGQAKEARRRIVAAVTDPRRFVRDKDKLVPLDPHLYFPRRPDVSAVQAIESQWLQTAVRFGPKAAADVWANKWVSEMLWDDERSIMEGTLKKMLPEEKR